MSSIKLIWVLPGRNLSMAKIEIKNESKSRCALHGFDKTDFLCIFPCHITFGVGNYADGLSDMYLFFFIYCDDVVVFTLIIIVECKHFLSSARNS